MDREQTVTRACRSPQQEETQWSRPTGYERKSGTVAIDRIKERAQWS